MAGGLCYSDDGSNNRGIFKEKRAAKRGRGGGGAKQKRRRKVVQEFDTNVFEVTLDCLENKGEVATGDAEICPTCSGVFNKFSKLTTED